LTAEAQAGLHNAEAYFEHPYFRHRRRSTGSLRRRCREIFKRLAAGANLRTLEGERLLDVGCDTGAFLAAAAEMFGVLPIGVDVSEAAVDEAKRKGIEAYHASLETAPAHLSNLAAVTAIDMIEHVSSPRAFLQEVYGRLRPSGVVYLETPNVASSVYRVGRVLCRMSHGHPRALFQRLFPVQHAQYFTKGSLRVLAQQCGFEVVKLDARCLPLSDIGTSLIIKVGVAGLQIVDRMTPSDCLLICALLRRPHSAAGEKSHGTQT
jgi:2-polyprenyl-3-methyl-5-hydroxy-6-metoxy-1,4-benzoquinol methylase